MIKNGLDGKLFDLIRSIYSEVMSCVKNIHTFSDFYESNVRLLQGEVLSPLILTVYQWPWNIFTTKSKRWFYTWTNFEPALVDQLDAPSDWRSGGRGFNPRRGRQHSFVEIDHEIFSTVILSLPLIQKGQLSVSGKRMCTILVNRLED